MLLQKGGYKLKRELRQRPSESQYDPSSVFIEHILPMILHRSATFQMISFESLFSFVMLLEIPIEYSNYVDDEEKPVGLFLLKICLTRRPGVIVPNYTLKATTPYSKKLMLAKEFYDEASLQQDIWNESMTNGLPEICAKTTNAVILTEHPLARSVANKIFERNDDIKNYLFGEIEKGNGLGIITMEYLKGIPLSSVTMPAQRIDSLKKLCAIALTLFLRYEILHCDLHRQNSLTDLKSRTVKALDFGRVVTMSIIADKVNTFGRAIDGFQLKIQGLTVLPPDIERAYVHSVQRFEQFRMLYYCFGKGLKKKITREDQVQPTLWFLINFELQWMLDVYGAADHSNIRDMFFQLKNDQTAIRDIFQYYQFYTTSNREPKTPLKEQFLISDRTPQELDVKLKMSDKQAYDRAYTSVQTQPSLTDPGNYLSEESEASKSKFNELNRPPEIQIQTDDAFFHQARLDGTPQSDEDLNALAGIHYANEKSRPHAAAIYKEDPRNEKIVDKKYEGTFQYEEKDALLDEVALPDEKAIPGEKVYVNRKRTNLGVFNDDIDTLPPEEKKGGTKRKKKRYATTAKRRYIRKPKQTIKRKRIYKKKTTMKR